MHPKVKAYYKYIKEHQKTQAELKETEKSWKDFSDFTEAFQYKTDALIKNILQLNDSPEVELYVPLLSQGLELMKKATAFSTRMSAYYKLHHPYDKALKEMLDKLTEENNNFNVLHPERTLKKCRATEQQYMPGIKESAEKINEMQHQLFKEREELHALYNSMNQ